MGRIYPSLKTIDSLSPNLQTALEVLPVSLAFSGMVSFNNWFLMRVGVGFYAIGKSLAIPFSVIMSYVVLKVSTSMKTIAACAVISAGVFVGSFWDTELTLWGMLLGALSSFFTASYQIAVKRGLERLEGDQWKLAFYNSLWVVLFLVPLGWVLGEGALASEVLVLDDGVNWGLFGALAFSGVVGFLIGQATYMSIHYTSALAHHVTGALKSCLQTMLGILIWSEPFTVSGIGGLMLTILGSYGFMMSRAAPKPKPVLSKVEENV